MSTDLDVLIAAGTEGELREELGLHQTADYSSADEVIRICKKLQDASLLLKKGKIFADEYFNTVKKNEKEEKAYCGSTSQTPKYVLQVLCAAKKMEAHGVNEILVDFGNRLFHEHGFKTLSSDSLFSNDSGVPEAIQAYKMADTPSSQKKAAEGYIEIGRPKEAAHLFHKIGDDAGVQDMILQIVKSGKFAEAMSLRAKLVDSAISAEELNIFMNAATCIAKENVMQKVEKYLVSHDKDEPFPTSHTFWHFSGGNSEWDDYRSTVYGLA
ncbi:hypothetical protein ACFLY5_00805, partial [Patescibacteria group bacterium]